ncbi:MAG: radical SAM protein, partial [Candidatus Thermoplasmatota archaeon]|nr:radical SAM protein [Candidatus Thermoplasmatota archaeon]
MNIRLSIGSAVLLGLSHGKIDALPTTIYTMLGERCVADCRFCAQARNSSADKKMLSRVIWPEFDLDAVLGKIDDKTKRVCIQTLKYPKLADDLVYLVGRIKDVSDIPVSACVNPLNKKSLEGLKDANLDRVGVGLDCASEKIFKKMKPSFKWNDYIKFLNDVTDVFGSGSAH